MSTLYTGWNNEAFRAGQRIPAEIQLFNFDTQTPEQDDLPQHSMVTFHPFSRLPFELRTQIWGYATEDRVLRVRKLYRDQGYWSPTPIPAVTRACFESRQNCNYRKAFVIGSSPRYIWTNFNCDVIQMQCELLSEESFPKRSEVRRLRIELVDERGWSSADSFYHIYSHKVRDFHKLESFDVLVQDGLRAWTNFIRETYWGAFLKGNVRIVDGKTGEWIDEKTSGAYEDYLDTNGGEHDHYTRVVDQYEDEDEDEVEKNSVERMEAIKRLQMPRPRIQLDY